jgi:hypothetical protein
VCVCVCVCVWNTHKYHTWTCAQSRVLLKFDRHRTLASQTLPTLTILVVWQTRTERARGLPIGHVVWFWNSRILKDEMRWYFAYMIWDVNRVIFTRLPPLPPPRSSAHLRSNGFYPYIIYAVFEIHSAGSFFP